MPFGAQGISGTTQFDQKSRAFVDMNPSNSPPSARERYGSSEPCTSWSTTTSAVSARSRRKAVIRARRYSVSR